MEELKREDFLGLGKTKKIVWRGKEVVIRELGSGEWVKIGLQEKNLFNHYSVYYSIKDSLPDLTIENILRLPNNHFKVLLDEINTFYEDLSKKKEK